MVGRQCSKYRQCSPPKIGHREKTENNKYTPLVWNTKKRTQSKTTSGSGADTLQSQAETAKVGGEKWQQYCAARSKSTGGILQSERGFLDLH